MTIKGGMMNKTMGLGELCIYIPRDEPAKYGSVVMFIDRSVGCQLIIQ